MAKKKDDEELTGAYFVATPFRDKDNFKKEWKEGQDVSHFDSERLKKLIQNGHVAEKNDKP